MSAPRPLDIITVDVAAAEARGPFQVMPALTADEFDALRADIAARGIVVPVVVDQHGRLLDGHHRRAIAAELGIDCPVEVRHVDDDDDARDLALTLNLARRHLTREQRRELIAREIEARPTDSDRAIGRRLGCDHKTVGSVRREASAGELPHPDGSVLSAAQARECTEQITAAIEQLDHDILLLLLRGMAPHEVAGMLTAGLHKITRDHPDEHMVAALREVIFEPRIAFVLDEGATAVAEIAGLTGGAR